MTEFIFFLVGLLLGSCIGITIMCCLQINRLYLHFARGLQSRGGSSGTDAQEQLRRERGRDHRRGNRDRSTFWPRHHCTVFRGKGTVIDRYGKK